MTASKSAALYQYDFRTKVEPTVVAVNGVLQSPRCSLWKLPLRSVMSKLGTYTCILSVSERFLKMHFDSRIATVNENACYKLQLVFTFPEKCEFFFLSCSSFVREQFPCENST